MGVQVSFLPPCYGAVSVLTSRRSDSNVGVCMDTTYINTHSGRKRGSNPAFSELESGNGEEKREVKVTYGNPVPPQPWEKREVKVTYGNPVPPQPWEKREVKVTYGNPVPPQPWEKREVKVTYGNPVPPQPWETRARPVVV